jgi:adenylate cyclase
LEKRQLPRWLAGRDIGPGQNFQEAITRAIRSARALVFLFSPHANDSGELKKELALASQHQIPVFPIRIASARPDDALAYEFATRQWIDLIDDVDAGLEQLATHILSASNAAPPTVRLPVAQLKDLPSRDKPSLAVLPFENLSDSSEQVYFAEGLAQDVLTELSKLRWLFVTSRNSSFTFGTSNVDAKEASQELGVRYILRGNVRRSGSRIRATAQLVDGPSGEHLWAERYDRDLNDIFTVQDEITKAVAAAIGPAIVDAERQRAVRKLPENLDAWEAYQRGLWHLSKHEPAENESARRYFERAIAIDPNFSPAYSALAHANIMAATVFYLIDYAEGADTGERLARQAVALDEKDAEAHARLALSFFVRGAHAAAIYEAELAIALNENCADAYGIKGASLAYSGFREEGRQALNRFLEISPRDPSRAVRVSQIAMSYYFDGDYTRAAEIAQQLIRQFPKSPLAYRCLAASLGQLGKRTEAGDVLRAVHTLTPLALQHVSGRSLPSMRGDDYKHYLAGLQKAGLEEIIGQ